jgi:hypothetical protein
MKTRALLPILALLLLAAAPAQAAEREMTLYSNAINVTPYSGEQHYMPLPANGQQAPADPGWITSIKVDVVKTRSESAKALSIQDVMIHHIVLHAFGAKWGNRPANCASQFFAMGEESQEVPHLGEYGIANVTAAGGAPDWFLTHADEPPRPSVQGLRADTDHLQRHAEDGNHAALDRHRRLPPRPGLHRAR